MHDSTGKCATSALVTSDWMVRCEHRTGANDDWPVQEQSANSHFSKEQIMKRFSQFLKTQEVALTVALVWMVVWAGFAMTDAFNSIA